MVREGWYTDPCGSHEARWFSDRGDAMTSSDFQQEINETRALEGELARSIRMLNGVRGARVHLVLPRHTPFAREPVLIDPAPSEAGDDLRRADDRPDDPDAVVDAVWTYFTRSSGGL